MKDKKMDVEIKNEKMKDGNINNEENMEDQVKMKDKKVKDENMQDKLKNEKVEDGNMENKENM